jgi:hypothetical protein
MQVRESGYQEFTMKILRYVVMVALLLGISGVAHAFQITVLDPPNADSPFFLIQPGVPFSFSFATCNVTVDDVNYTGCALGFNDSKETLTNFTLGFDNAPVLDGAEITCSSNAFSDINCGLTSDQGEYALNFEDACGSDTCGILPFHFVVLLENAVPGADFPNVDGIANTPEPGSIWLALSGLGSAGYLIRRRRKT